MTSNGSIGLPSGPAAGWGPSSPGRQTRPRRRRSIGTNGSGPPAPDPPDFPVAAGGLAIVGAPSGEYFGSPSVPPVPGGGGQLTVVRAGDGRPLRKVPSPGDAGSGGSPTGESPSSGAETTQSGGTVTGSPPRLRRNMVKRPTPREQALSDGVRCLPDRRGERAVECCLKRKGAYYHDLAGSSGNWRAAGPRTEVFGPGTPPPRA